MEKWIATVVGQMHLHKIKQDDLAAALGVSRVYLNKILNGKENPILLVAHHAGRADGRVPVGRSVHAVRVL